MKLRKQENRINKSYSFIKTSLSTKNDLQNVDEKDIIIANTMCKIVELINTKFKTQCNKR